MVAGPKYSADCKLENVNGEITDEEERGRLLNKRYEIRATRLQGHFIVCSEQPWEDYSRTRLSTCNESLNHRLVILLFKTNHPMELNHLS
ncbi:hypothetical protein CDAR_96041 [Caerostris darwini]|uniref:Uncharacterized protein n=1 Tax=Caerostris darwini TaxID=1538125 RepID=A0AAV4UQ08_9ARAC|nr:hypothetical protein CDAR_96041 [Caerostris darwini]